MFTREDIRYHALWVRLLCCLAVAVGVANAVYFDLTGPLEWLLRDLLGATTQRHRYLSGPAEVWLLFALCAVCALPRIERPLAMIGLGGGFMAAYLGAVLAAMFLGGTMLPVASPLLALAGSTTVLETMAWSEERSRRRKLEALEVARQQFTDMLVHDLKKRISSLLMAVSMLEQKQIDRSGKRVDSLRTLRVTAERLLILVNSLLDIRKVQEGRMVLQRERVLLGELIEEGVSEHRAAAELMGFALRVSGAGAPAANVDRRIFQRILANLLWNAFQHAPAESEIEIGYGAVGAGSRVHVGNRGPTIPAAGQAALFHPFAGTRDHATDSMGLGLAFCKLAVEAHGGRLEIESPWREHGDGVNVVLHLPPAGAMPSGNTM